MTSWNSPLSGTVKSIFGIALLISGLLLTSCTVSYAPGLSSYVPQDTEVGEVIHLVAGQTYYARFPVSHNYFDIPYNRLEEQGNKPDARYGQGAIVRQEVYWIVADDVQLIGAGETENWTVEVETTNIVTEVAYSRKAGNSSTRSYDYSLELTFAITPPAEARGSYVANVTLKLGNDYHPFPLVLEVKGPHGEVGPHTN